MPRTNGVFYLCDWRKGFPSILPSTLCWKPEFEVKPEFWDKRSWQYSVVGVLLFKDFYFSYVSGCVHVSAGHLLWVLEEQLVPLTTEPSLAPAV